MHDHFVHIHSIRSGPGEEILVARVVAGGKVGYGFSLQLDATAARHMAEWNAGVRTDIPESLKIGLPPEIQAVIASVRWLP